MTRNHNLINILCLLRIPSFALLTISLIVAAQYSYGQLKQGETKSKKILFIGNSYTYVNNLYKIVAIMGAERDTPLITKKETNGGVSLQNHWNGERGLKTLERLDSEEYDFIVLQEQSRRPITNPEQTKKYASLLCDKIMLKGAQPVLYLTWARENAPETQEQLNATYTSVAKDKNVLVAPVGPAWQRAMQLNPEIELYGSDGSHPSNMGTYLAACVIYAVITNQSPTDLPTSFWTEDSNGDPIYLMEVNSEMAKICQQAASEAIEEFNKTIHNQ